MHEVERAAREQGHVVERVALQSVAMGLPIHRVEVADSDLLLILGIPAGSLEQITMRMDWLKQLHALGVPVVNQPNAIEACVDKWETSWRLRRAGIPTPETWVCQTVDHGMASFDRFEGDIVIKPLFGSQGQGIVRLQDRQAVEQELAVRVSRGEVIYIQPYVFNPGYDVRLLVLDGQIVGAMKRRAVSDWRTNIAQGARAERHAPSVKEMELALAAARAVGTDLAGVDLLPTHDGHWQVLEVNGVPGWQALSRVVDVDIPKQIVDALVKRIS